MTVCKGCGAVLQTTDPKALGYTPKEGSDYCKRCFRLIHYDDLTVSMRTGIDPDEVLANIEKMEAVVLWVVDLFDFEAGMISGMQRRIGNKDIVLACTKRDLLPDTLNHEKLARFVFSRLKEQGLSVKELVFTSGLNKMGAEEVKEALEKVRNGRPVVVMGRANAGKSTLLNCLAGQNVLTSSRYPGTTLAFNEMDVDGVKYIDTPGIEIGASMLMNCKEEDLKTLIPSSRIKPQVYQVKDDQSYAVGGMARLDIYGCSGTTVTWYVSDRMPIHRGAAKNADELWKKHYGELLKPTPLTNDFRARTIDKKDEKLDIVIDGLGWVCLSGSIRKVVIHAPKGVNVTFRKAML